MRYIIMQYILLAALSGLLMFGGVSADKKVTLTGVLQRSVAVGGESTGWRILLAPALKGEYPEGSIDVDPGGMDIRQFNGKTVEARGRLVSCTTLERGQHRVLELKSVKESGG